MRFLETLGCHWNITLFHYRTTVPTMVACSAPSNWRERLAEFEHHLQDWLRLNDVPADPAYQLFRRPTVSPVDM
jgi:hypothetical protein